MIEDVATLAARLTALVLWLAESDRPFLTAYVLFLIFAMPFLLPLALSDIGTCRK